MRTRQEIFASTGLRNWCWAVAVSIIAAGCGRRSSAPRAPYLAVSQLEAVYGPLIGAANHPTPDQHGTGDRVGLFRDSTGTVWGLPLAVAENGAVLGCAPPALHDAPVTDTLPARATDIIGATNAPTGWRGGTGKLELVFRNKSGDVDWRTVSARALPSGPECWAQESPGPRERLEYYRLAPPAGEK